MKRESIEAEARVLNLRAALKDFRAAGSRVAPEGRSVALKDFLAAGSPVAPEGRSVALKDFLAAGSPVAPARPRSDRPE